jgi:hypothetical protein
MKTARLAFMATLFISTIVSSAWCDTTHSGRPGAINYVEGQATIGTQKLSQVSIGSVELAKGQILTTQAGKVEILLTPGIFLRVADNSSLKMVSPDLANIVVELDKGRAIIETIDIHKANSIRLEQSGATATVLKKGLYDFDADDNQIRVFSGEADVRGDDQDVNLSSKHMVAVGTGSPLKSNKFDSRLYEDEFYRWSALRSAYLSEASIDEARAYVGPGPSWYGPGWIGWGWYWNPWYGAYTYLPADGILWSPFGWGFYSPIFVYRSPYFYGPHYPHGFGDFHGPYGHGYGVPRGGFRR